MINKILFPTDFSKNATKAMHFAGEVAQFTGAELILLHAQHVPTVDIQDATMVLDSAMYELKTASETELEGCKATLEKAFFLKKVTTEVEFGFARDMILEKANETNADLVIMGTKGSSDLIDNLLGGVTTNVMKSLKKTLMVIPPLARFSKFKNIAFASLLDNEDVEKLDWFMEFTALFKPDMHVLHVINKGQQLSSEQQIVLDQMGHHFKDIMFEALSGEDVADSIEKYVEKEHIDLLAMRAEERGFFEDLFHRSVTKHVAMHSKTPLIIFH